MADNGRKVIKKGLNLSKRKEIKLSGKKGRQRRRR